MRRVVAALSALLALLCHTVMTMYDPNEESADLVVNIRRQLMTNNYDYTGSADEDAPPAPAPAPAQPPPPPPGAALGPHVNDIFIPRSHTGAPPAPPRTTDRAVNKNDLLYYMDEHRLQIYSDNNDTQKNNTLDNDSSQNNDIMSSENNGDDTASAKPIYKVLKVKQPSPRRRSAQYRRFLQEESAAGVALVSLDRRPFPEFRLPQPRRQYMQTDELSLEALPSSVEDYAAPL